ncbi:Fe2+-dependent dioxygenase [Terrarubrum flagellatum]|uniref:Fe2+-dependent dioxygenase n=1 Tax=Terrirubrum flagellatum TaxID=2895980 RepID=UPI00314503B2
MLLCIPDVLTPEEVAQCRKAMSEAEWQDGRATAGPQAAAVKKNYQLPLESPVSKKLGELVLAAVSRSPLFMSAALPLRILPPMFNHYGEGQTFGVHVDGAIRTSVFTGERLRTDLSATLFLSEPEEYDGGDLSIETLYGANEVKLPAGHLVLYPSTSLHCVTPVTRGMRVASIFWVQSMIRDEGQRTILFDLDRTVQELQAERGADDEATVRLAGVYHNLIRQWAET